MALPPWLFAALVLIVVCGIGSYKLGVYENFYRSFEWSTDILQDISGLIFPSINSSGRIVDRGLTSKYDDDDLYDRLIRDRYGGLYNPATQKIDEDAVNADDNLYDKLIAKDIRDTLRSQNTDEDIGNNRGSRGSDSTGSGSTGSDSRGSDSRGSGSTGSGSRGSDSRGSDSRGSDSRVSDSRRSRNSNTDADSKSKDLVGAGGSAAAAGAAPAFHAPPGSYLLTIQPADSMLYAPKQSNLDTIQDGSDKDKMAAAHTPSVTRVFPDAKYQRYLPSLTASTDTGNTYAPSLRQMIRDDIDNTVKNEIGKIHNEYAIQYAYQ